MRIKAGQSKYRAVKTEVDGIVFHSKREARRYGELTLLQRAGKITGLLLQPKYGLWILPFARADVATGELLKCGDYIGDFQYWDAAGGRMVLEDVKGYSKNSTYRLKKRIVEALYGITIKEV